MKGHNFVKERQQNSIHSKRLQGVNLFEFLDVQVNLLWKLSSLVIVSKIQRIFFGFIPVYWAIDHKNSFYFGMFTILFLSELFFLNFKVIESFFYIKATYIKHLLLHHWGVDWNKPKKYSLNITDNYQWT